jgi:hypothetical protein
VYLEQTAPGQQLGLREVRDGLLDAAARSVLLPGRSVRTCGLRDGCPSVAARCPVAISLLPAGPRTEPRWTTCLSSGQFAPAHPAEPRFAWHDILRTVGQRYESRLPVTYHRGASTNQRNVGFRSRRRWRPSAPWSVSSIAWGLHPGGSGVCTIERPAEMAHSWRQDR